MSKKVFIRTFGCQMNVRDSEVISGLLKAQGYKFATDLDEADIIIFNTCSVRQHAEDKVWSEIGRVSKHLKPSAKYQKPLIGVAGCMAQNYKEDIFKRAPDVDFIVGPADIHKIPEIIKKLSVAGFQLSTGKLFESKIWETEGQIRPEEIYHTGFRQEKDHCYIVISEGCSNYCSYCVVPYVRGQLRNRNSKDILHEIEEAVTKGIHSITLLGQNVNAYKNEDVDFINLIRLVDTVKGLKEFSFITSHPKDISPQLFKIMAQLDKIKKYLHLPVQSGSDRILKLMNRGYARKYYLDLVGNYRRIVKGGCLSTDIIVGFPGESEEDFMDTYNLVNEVKFDSAYIFKYSARPHAQAQGMFDDVNRAEKERRHKLILDLQKEISKKCSKK